MAAGLVFVAGVLVLLVATPFGNRLLLDQSQQLAASLLPADVTIEVGSRHIGFTPSGGITLRFDDVVLARPQSGQQLAAAGNVAVGFSLLDILSGELSAQKLRVDHLTVDPDALGSGEGFEPPDVEAIFAALDHAAASASGMPLNAIEINDLQAIAGAAGDTRITRVAVEKGAAGIIGLELLASLAGSRFGAIGTAEISADGLGLERLDLQTGEVELPTSGGDGPAAAPLLSLSLGLDGEAGARRLRLAAAGQLAEEAAEGLRGNLAFEVSEGSERADVVADFSDATSIEGQFSGAIDLASAADGTAPFRLASTRLVSTIASHAAPALAEERSARFAARGVFDLTRGAIRIDDAELALASGWLKATAALAGHQPQDHLTASFEGRAIDARDLVAFWPFFVADGPRDWALDHLRAGVVDETAFSLDLTIERLLALLEPAVPMREDEFQLALAFSGGAFTTLDDMPALSTASGTIQHRGGRVAVSLDEASVDGQPGLAVLPSSLDFQHAGDGVDAALSLNIEGDAAQLVELAERQKLLAGQERDWQAKDLSGKANVGVGVAFHLADPRVRPEGSDPSALNWTVVAELAGVDLKKPIDGHRLSGLTGTAMIAEGSAIGEMSGRIDDIPAKVTFAQPLGPDPVGEASLKIAARLDDRSIARLSPVLARMLGGSIAVDLTRRPHGFAATADLTRAEIRLPAIGWSKSAGIPGTLTFDIARNGSVTKVADAVLEGEGFSANGSAELDGDGLKSLVLNSLALNRGDSVSARLTRIAGGMGFSVAANSIDARPILAALQSRIAAPDDGEPDDTGKLVVELSADTLRGFGDEALEDAEIRYKADDDRVLSASLSASIRGAPVSLAFQPGVEGVPAVRVDVARAGALLRFAGLYDKMREGRLQANLGARDGAYAGGVRLSDFTLVDEERLRSLVGTARQQSDSLAARLGKDLPVASAYFDTARANLRWDKGRLILDDGIIRGPVFGSSFSGILIDPSGRVDMAGSFMPAYGVNRLFGALPFVGGVLGNGGEGGLIGITYRLEGTLADPTLVVNPISLIAPGIFRRIFEY
ncbi:hypothetical protein ATO4_02275 [Aurantimonas sp. 22II-16-19i]|nr:hypothetical protein ATO4_02275 [Aurantimonas sp. 22II-16-19i]